MNHESARPGYDPQISGHTEPTVPRAPFMSLFMPYWRSRERWLSLLLLALMFSLTFSAVYFSVWQNKWKGHFYNLIGAHQFSQLDGMVLSLVLILLVSGTAVVLGYLINNAVQIRWRTWLTHYLVERWMARQTYHRIERDHLLDNADQRIADDVKLFVTTTMTLGSDVVQVVVSTVTYTSLLYSLTHTGHFHVLGHLITIPGYMVIAAYAYSIGTLLLTHGIGRRLVGINVNQQQVEAFFRVHMVRIRDASEQIAFYQGAPRETSWLLQSFEDIRVNFWRLTGISTAVLFATSIYGDIAGVLPTVLSIPSLTAGQLSIGGLMQIASAFTLVTSTTSFFSQAYQQLAAWWAVSNRLRELLHACASEDGGGIQLRRAEEDVIRIEALQLRRPDGEPLLSLPALCLRPGERYLISGYSGLGKSTLFRAMAGLWPHGQGEVICPATARLMFVPQKSYIPDGSLKDVLTYPAAAGDFSDAQCLRILHLSGLARYAADLHEQDRWQRRLSGGEQQRIAMARVLLQRPDYVFLDEATSALDAAGAVQLYSLLLEELPATTVVSIAHTPLLQRFHTHQLDLSMAAAAALPDLVGTGGHREDSIDAS